MSRRGERIGRAGESATLALYRGRGYRVVARNWRTRIGELDLVLERDGTLIFCEVKTRSSRRLGGAYEGVTAAKRRKVRALAEAFLLATGLDPRRCRFDVASVALDRRGRPRVHLYEDAF
jgi:putative endonuclease